MDKRNKKCKRCGMIFAGSPHAWYCDECKQKSLLEQREKDLQRIKSKKYEQVCMICGKNFTSYKKKQTCGTECELKLRSMSHIGKEMDGPAKDKIADKNCIKWHLVSPGGEHYEFHNLREWARNNCKLFGFRENSKDANKIVAGISGVKGSLLGTNSSPVKTYKGWSVVIEYGPDEICRLYQNGWSVNKIHSVSGVSASKIRKILITSNLWENDLSKEIKIYLEQGKAEEEIAKLLGISEKVINSYVPYSKGVYKWKPSDNALNIKKCRDRKKEGC